jgi:triacylglycerol lipase
MTRHPLSATPTRVAQAAAGAARFAWWRATDYAYVLRRQVEGAVRPGGPDAYLTPARPQQPDVVLVPGLYESWHFLRPVAEHLHGHGHRVHVLPALGYNRGPIPAAAHHLGRFVVEKDLHDVAVVAHSKGGLIGKLAMLREDPDSRIASMVAVNTPFAGSSYARWVPLPSVRAFVPTDATLLALAAEGEVNARITSVFSHWDPHIPDGSTLAGALNVRLSTAGHFRVLKDPVCLQVVLDQVRTVGRGTSATPGRVDGGGRTEP